MGEMLFFSLIFLELKRDITSADRVGEPPTSLHRHLEVD